jgi:acetylornithine deacetylase/succinyl-diaminopimelate desuccinylase-like protein
VAAHLDTVFPAGTDVKVRREGTRLMAPGIGDDTLGLAVMLAMVRAMDKAGIRTERDIVFIANVGEEGPGDLRGMRHFFAQDPRAKQAAVFITIDGAGAGWITTRGWDRGAGAWCSTDRAGTASTSSASSTRWRRWRAP